MSWDIDNGWFLSLGSDPIDEPALDNVFVENIERSCWDSLQIKLILIKTVIYIYVFIINGKDFSSSNIVPAKAERFLKWFCCH